MTSLSPEFFDKRDEEIEAWKSKDFTELHDFLIGTGFILEDLEIIGIIREKFTLAGLEGLDGHEPTPEWKDQFREGNCMTTFLPCELGARIIEMLQNDGEITKRVEHRQELYLKRKLELEKRRLLEEKAKEKEEYEKMKEREPVPAEQSTKVLLDSSSEGTQINRAAPEPTDNPPDEDSYENSSPLSTTGLVAVPSMLLLSALILRYLGSSDTPGPVEWGLIALFSYSPIRYIFRAGLGNVASQIKALAIATVMLFVIGVGISNCSGTSTSGSSCWYIVGCI